MKHTQDLFSHRKPEPEESVLYIVGTPIGNLNDISFRAVNILKKVSIIACEDTRVTGKLLNHLDIKNKLISFHKHNSFEKLESLIEKLNNGDSIALVSDAGMPLISDPGERLVKEAKANNFDVICIPGPCAVINALISSGIATSEFKFYGFLPKTGKERNHKLEEISNNNCASVIYESPKRVLKLLVDLKLICEHNRNVVVMKEMTKRFEQNLGYNFDMVINHLKGIEPKGEFTVVIGAKEPSEKDHQSSNHSLKNDLLSLINAGLSHSAASNYLAKKSGKPKKEIYNLIIKNDFKNGDNIYA